jgi:precorrin-2 dehydrogenase / sirohydrochlorin ferrochelatase
LAVLPIIADVKRLKVILAGNGPQTLKRLTMLDAAGCADLRVFARGPDALLRTAAGLRLVERFPIAADFTGAAVAFAGDLSAEEGERFYAMAKAAGALVNVEDVLPLCDFHVPSLVRRGALVISISTGGRSPALAQMIRERIENEFGPEWEERLDAVAAQRAAWRAQGLSGPEISARTRAAAQDWFAAEPKSLTQKRHSP